MQKSTTKDSIPWKKKLLLDNLTDQNPLDRSQVQRVDQVLRCGDFICKMLLNFGIPAVTLFALMAGTWLILSLNNEMLKRDSHFESLLDRTTEQLRSVEQNLDNQIFQVDKKTIEVDKKVEVQGYNIATTLGVIDDNKKHFDWEVDRLHKDVGNLRLQLSQEMDILDRSEEMHVQLQDKAIAQANVSMHQEMNAQIGTLNSRLQREAQRICRCLSSYTESWA